MIVIAGTIPVKAERWNDAKALAVKMVEETLKQAEAGLHQLSVPHCGNR